MSTQKKPWSRLSLHSFINERQASSISIGCMPFIVMRMYANNAA
ncbi:hypothetical protein BIFGAL_04344 [Bifidobacterium gallicum DSM 20093 = LMG 11596]|uniref:Uncharacterized protein n=1 Tax=Bifidobacterium gallicum DSM 20093 = LMG 11596 TaxID=561180 RepID=D1NWT8_9BIFI|nr:hypothetical protein BIFGAL_04344 [Bifidobacterium gallicum DSM 20093 = LMG 11596]